MKIVPFLKLISCETKLVLLYFISKNMKLSVNGFAKITRRSVKNVSKQLNELKLACIIKEVKEGREKFYFLANCNKKISQILEIVLEAYFGDKSRCSCINEYIKKEKLCRKIKK